jgi:CubicO group peptidase (beta-lactamase class C family)
MDRWLAAAIDYVPKWIEHQMRLTQQPGCVIAIAQSGRVILEQAYGHADLARGVEMTPRHRFRVASHSKSFTSAGIMKLREQGRLRLDDPAGRHVDGLHPEIARATLAQLLSHTAGIIRDGTDAGQWTDRRPFRNEAELRADLAEAPIIAPNTRYKYSNHGFGLLGLVIQSVTGESYNTWIKREIVDAVGLEETRPDVPLARSAPFARGHSAPLPVGRRLVIPGTNSTRALASATGFVSTAVDLARFFNQLAPGAKRSALTPASRREMVRGQWRIPHVAGELSYGLGIRSGATGDWPWFGHSGGFQGYVTHTGTYAPHDITVSCLTNAADGRAVAWVQGTVHILRHFARHGAPSRKLADWTSRWWSLWGAVDLLPVGDRVVVVNPGMPDGFPDAFKDAGEIEVTGRDRGWFALASGGASHGEAVRRERDARGRVVAVWLAGSKYLPEAQVAREMTARYGKGRTP